MQMPPGLKSITARAGAPLLAALALAGCATAPPPEPSAIVRLSATQIEQPRPGTPVTGVVRLQQRGDEVILRGTVENLRASGSHGFYIHEKGDCSAPDASSAGGHFNPTNKEHSFVNSGHVGDLPSLIPSAEGKAPVYHISKHIKLSGPTSVIGKAVVVHRDRDNPAHLPDGGSGPGIACGVIEAEAPKK
jgi:Cu-Zn family superoxide dismutase